MEMTKELFEVLDALCDMYNQYCSPPGGHMFMSAGENAEEVLSKYGLLKNENAQSAEVDFDQLEKLRKSVYPNLLNG